ncbi:MAG: hypothetical protein WKG07_44085 [Hymenobacter sp.]
MSVGFEGALIVIAGAFILYSAALSFWHPHCGGAARTGAALLVGTAVVNFGLGLWLVRAGRRVQSVALVAMSLAGILPLRAHEPCGLGGAGAGALHGRAAA